MSTLTAQQVIDLIVTSFETGSSLIFSLSDHYEQPIPEGVDVGTPPAASERIGLAVLAGQPVLVTDAYGDNETGHLTLEALEAAVIQLAAGDVEGWFDNHDVCDADQAMQRAAYGEVIYA